MLTGRGLPDPQLVRDEEAANTIVYEISVNLRREVLARVLEPAQNRQPVVVGQCLENVGGRTGRGQIVLRR